MTEEDTILYEHLTAIYGSKISRETLTRLRALINSHMGSLAFKQRAGALRPKNHPGDSNLTERDAILITYGDQLRESFNPPLRSLANFCELHLTGLLSNIHILPFYPYSSDDGFSVINYRQVDPAMGDWEDIAHLDSNFHLMFDAVINHISKQSDWFQAFLKDEPRYRDYFIVVEGQPDFSQVVRPRALPLLTTVETTGGSKKVWTTFSADQVDLNYHNPDVLLDIISLLLFYISHGAEFIRLDAIAYIWKEIGTSCVHLPQTHQIIQLLRAILDTVSPHVKLITETNFPHAENISYFGDGENEAQLVYNFALPPLVLNAFYTTDVSALSRWATGLKPPSKRTSYLNFLASHDGIGINPARGILSDAQIDAIINQVINHGGLVSYKQNLDGTRSPYELNINFFDALSNPCSTESLSKQVDRFMTAQAIMLSLAGVPGIYFHSLFGSRGWPEGVEITGRNRTINRQKLNLAELEVELAGSTSLRWQVFSRYMQLLLARASSSAFHPHGEQRIMNCGEAIFTVHRLSPDGGRSSSLCLHNISDRFQSPYVDWQHIFQSNLTCIRDLITGLRINLEGGGITLKPYQTLWCVREE